MLMLRTTLAVVFLTVASLPSTVFGHGFMSSPAARSVGMPNEDYQYCFETPDCTCGEYAEAGPIVATYEAGQTVRVTIEVTRSHTEGHTFRFQLCPPDDQTLGCFQSGEFAVRNYNTLLGTHEVDITIPEGIECDPCVLRWKWDYGFLSCADVRILGARTPVDDRTWTALKASWR